MCPYMQNDADNDVVNLMEGLPMLSSVTHLTLACTPSWRVHTFGASIAKLLSRCCRLQSLDVNGNYPLVSLYCNCVFLYPLI
jgi:hypothetical protein